MKVCIVGGGSLYSQLFKGFEIIGSPEGADLLVFTGGEDVNPALYGEKAHRSTHFNAPRDTWETGVFKAYPEIPKVGICRGGQFLNVMAGGHMFQNVDRHANGPHKIYSPDGGVPLCMATSTHHQMMIPGKGAKVLAIGNESGTRETATSVEHGAHDDTEVVYYEHTRSLCFQPHPEFPNATDGLRAFFFDCVKQHLGVYLAAN